MFGLTTALLLAIQPIHLGGDERWAAFRLADGRCEARGRAWRVLPDSQRHRQPMMRFTFRDGGSSYLHVGLRRKVRDGAAVTVAVDDAAFVLEGTGYDAFADPKTTRAIVAALRTGAKMRVTARAASGSRFTDYYPLGGVQAGIDAAAAGCAGQPRG